MLRGITRGDIAKMGKSIKGEAETYVGSSMRNISELDSVSVDLVVMKEDRKRADGSSYEAQYIVVDGEEYRVPNTVLRDLKEILKKKPKMKTFSVSRVGKGKEDTKYTVVPLD